MEIQQREKSLQHDSSNAKFDSGNNANWSETHICHSLAVYTTMHRSQENVLS